MPAPLKALLSAMIMLACLGLFYYDWNHGGGIEKWVVLLLGPLMVVSIWIFPEAKAREIRKETGKQRR